MKINNEVLRYSPNQSIDLRNYYLSLLSRWLSKQRRYYE